MFAVIFEVEPKPGRAQDYLDRALSLKTDLEKIDGFISIERFSSLTNAGKIVSLSFWRDDAAIERCASGSGIGGRKPAAATSSSRITASTLPPCCANTA